MTWSSLEDLPEDTLLRGKNSLETNLPIYAYVYIQQVYSDVVIKNVIYNI